MIAVNEEGIVVLANPAVRPMLGLDPEVLAGRPLAEAIGHAPLRELFAQRRLGISELPLPDGRTAQASLVAVTTAHGESIGLAAVLRDVTVLKSLEQMKSDFVATVSHDLKNPITVIETTAALMRRAGPGDARHDAALRADRGDVALHDLAGGRPARPREDPRRPRVRAGAARPGAARRGRAADARPARDGQEPRAIGEAAGRDARRRASAPARAGAHEPRGQRDQVHASGRPGVGDRGPRPRRRRRRRPRGARRARQRHRDPVARPSVRVRPLLPGRRARPRRPSPGRASGSPS